MPTETKTRPRWRTLREAFPAMTVAPCGLPGHVLDMDVYDVPPLDFSSEDTAYEVLKYAAEQVRTCETWEGDPSIPNGTRKMIEVEEFSGNLGVIFRNVENPKADEFMVTRYKAGIEIENETRRGCYSAEFAASMTLDFATRIGDDLFIIYAVEAE